MGHGLTIWFVKVLSISFPNGCGQNEFVFSGSSHLIQWWQGPQHLARIKLKSPCGLQCHISLDDIFFLQAVCPHRGVLHVWVKSGFGQGQFWVALRAGWCKDCARVGLILLPSKGLFLNVRRAHFLSLVVMSFMVGVRFSGAVFHPGLF